MEREFPADAMFLYCTVTVAVRDGNWTSLWNVSSQQMFRSFTVQQNAFCTYSDVITFCRGHIARTSGYSAVVPHFVGDEDRYKRIG
jgi:hypothetical protein